MEGDSAKEGENVWRGFVVSGERLSAEAQRQQRERSRQLLHEQGYAITAPLLATPRPVRLSLATLP